MLTTVSVFAAARSHLLKKNTAGQFFFYHQQCEFGLYIEAVKKKKKK